MLRETFIDILQYLMITLKLANEERSKGGIDGNRNRNLVDRDS